MTKAKGNRFLLCTKGNDRFLLRRNDKRNDEKGNRFLLHRNDKRDKWNDKEDIGQGSI